MTIGSRIKELREQKNISQEKLALDINVSRQTISKWENDSVLPDSNNLSVLSNYFNVTTDYLINGTENNIEVNQKNTVFDKKWLIIYIIFLVIGTLILILGILFLTVDVLKDSVKLSSRSSFIDIPVGIILLVTAGIIYAINGIKLFFYVKNLN